jgi:tetratricopeptide (TPR) repeat protein
MDDSWLWSLVFKGNVLQTERSVPIKNLPLPPDNHSRALLWLARDALSNDNPTHAQDLIAPLAESGNHDALIILGESLAAQGNFSAAVEAWILAHNYQYLHDVAETVQDEGRLDDALIAYHAARFLDPDAGTLPLVNFLCSHYNSCDDAEALLRQSLMKYPKANNYLDWQLRLGYLLRGQKRWDESFDVYQRILTKDPDNWSALIGLGWIYYGRDNDLDAAVLTFQKAISLDPERGDGYFEIGKILAREKRYAEADIWFAKALEVYPTYRWWYIYRANVARDAGNLPLALDIYQQASERFPDWAPVYYEMSYAYKMAGQQQEAIEAIDKALSLMNTPNDLYYHRAR